MWELLQLDKKTFKFNLLGTFGSIEEGIAARTDMMYQFVLFTGPLDTSREGLRDLVGLINNFHHNDIFLVMDSNQKISGQFLAVHDAEGNSTRVKCYYWSPANPGYGWMVDGGPYKP